MRFKLSSAALVVWVLALSSALSQTSINIVGYYNRVLYPGDNLLANQLVASDNSLNGVLATGVPEGSTFTKWDPLANAFLPYSIFDGGTWSINYSFNPIDGLGGVLNAPSRFTNTFIGEVYQGHDAAHHVDGPLFGYWDGTPRGGGLLLLADQDPITAGFDRVVGRAPQDGEWVRTLNELSQVYSVTTFHQGSGWDNGEPALAVGQAAYFHLVPEPSTAALAALGAIVMVVRRRGSSRARNQLLL
jgi:hypothetical protein